MNKKILIITIAIVALIVLSIAGYFYWQKFKAPKLTPEEQAIGEAGEAAEKITESAAKSALPSLDINKNPLEEAPDINPASQANPFKDIKTNPFK
ncbi:MAG: hypothetical protein AAB366_00095 [Patescibacteria group bacterium]